MFFSSPDPVVRPQPHQSMADTPISWSPAPKKASTEDKDKQDSITSAPIPQQCALQAAPQTATHLRSPPYAHPSLWARNRYRCLKRVSRKAVWRVGAHRDYLRALHRLCWAFGVFNEKAEVRVASDSDSDVGWDDSSSSSSSDSDSESGGRRSEWKTYSRMSSTSRQKWLAGVQEKMGFKKTEETGGKGEQRERKEREPRWCPLVRPFLKELRGPKYQEHCEKVEAEKKARKETQKSAAQEESDLLGKSLSTIEEVSTSGEEQDFGGSEGPEIPKDSLRGLGDSLAQELISQMAGPSNTVLSLEVPSEPATDSAFSAVPTFSFPERIPTPRNNICLFRRCSLKKSSVERPKSGLPVSTRPSNVAEGNSGRRAGERVSSESLRSQIVALQTTKMRPSMRRKLNPPNTNESCEPRKMKERRVRLPGEWTWPSEEAGATHVPSTTTDSLRRSLARNELQLSGQPQTSVSGLRPETSAGHFLPLLEEEIENGKKRLQLQHLQPTGSSLFPILSSASTQAGVLVRKASSRTRFPTPIPSSNWEGAWHSPPGADTLPRAMASRETLNSQTTRTSTPYTLSNATRPLMLGNPTEKPSIPQRTSSANYSLPHSHVPTLADTVNEHDGFPHARHAVYPAEASSKTREMSQSDMSLGNASLMPMPSPQGPRNRPRLAAQFASGGGSTHNVLADTIATGSQSAPSTRARSISHKEPPQQAKKSQQQRQESEEVKKVSFAPNHEEIPRPSSVSSSDIEDSERGAWIRMV